jgi:hypothetical protein
MKTGDRIRIAIISQRGRKVNTVSFLRLEKGAVFAEITPESSTRALKQIIKTELIRNFIQPTTKDAEFCYQGETCGAVLIPDIFWNEVDKVEDLPTSVSPIQGSAEAVLLEEETESVPDPSSSKPISFPLPRKVQRLIRNLPIRSKEIPEAHIKFLKKVVCKVGHRRAEDVAKTFTPLLNDIIKSLPKDATFEDAFRRLYELQQDILVSSRTLAATIPIVLFKSLSDKPESHASGVLIKIGGKYFLLTAAHVLDAGDHSDLYAGLNDSFVSLAGMWSRTPLPPSEDRTDDNEDIGYCCLESSETGRKLASSWNVLGRADVIVDEAVPGPSFRVCGYPATKIEIGDGYVETVVSSIEGFEIASNEYEQLGLSPKVNIAIRFNRKRMFSPLLARTITPMQILGGMSGGGIYVETPVPEPPFMKFLLVGITTTHHLGKSLIIGTRLDAFVRQIYRNRPELFG